MQPPAGGTVIVDRRSEALDELLDPEVEIELLADGFGFLEGPIWDGPSATLLFSDIPRDTIHSFGEGADIEVARRPSSKSNGLTRDNAGRLIACEHVSSSVTRTEQDGTVTTLASHWQGKGLNSPNDVCVSRRGAVYFTDPSDGRTNAQYGLVRPREIDFHGVYCIPPGGGEPLLLADDLLFPNGVCLSPDERTLYVNDSMREHVLAYDLQTDGTVGERRVFVEQPGTGAIADGCPDGMKCDERGNLWATAWSGIWVVAPSGELLGVVRTPEFAANLAFGGAGWSDLYLTATHGLYRLPTRTRSARVPHVVHAELQGIAEGLRAQLAALRVTIRLDDTPRADLPVKAEAVAPGALAIAAILLPGVRDSGTARWVERERRVLVQDDIAASSTVPVTQLVEQFGARAQLLAPILDGDRLIGLLSVHSGQLRTWNAAEIAAAEQAAAAVVAAAGPPSLPPRNT